MLCWRSNRCLQGLCQHPLSNSIIQSKAVFPSSLSYVHGHGQSWPRLFASWTVVLCWKTRPFARCHWTTFIWTYWMTLTNLYSGNRWKLFQREGKRLNLLFSGELGLLQVGNVKGARTVVMQRMLEGEQSEGGPVTKGRMEETGAKAE